MPICIADYLLCIYYGPKQITLAMEILHIAHLYIYISFVLMLYVPVNNFTVLLGWFPVFLLCDYFEFGPVLHMLFEIFHI